MRSVCPPELEFNSALDKCKDLVRKARHRHNEKQAFEKRTLLFAFFKNDLK